MPQIDLPHITIDFNEHGSPDGTPVLLLHGFPDSAASWDGFLQVWNGPPARFIVPSLRGYGRSRVTAPENESGEVAALAGDALLLLEALGTEKAVLVGHDWGARAAWAAAALAPDQARAVVGLASEYTAYRNTGVLPHAQERDYWYQWFFHTPQGAASLERDRTGLCRYLWQVWSPKWHFNEDDLKQAAQAWENPQFVATVLSYYRTRHGNASGAPSYAAQSERLEARPSIVVPAWFLTGLADACNHPEGSLGQEDWFAGGYRRIELPGVGHFIHREAPEAVAAAVAEAIESTSERESD